ncbi:phosphatase PAP2 family protein [Virgibacillus natechei]
MKSKELSTLPFFIIGGLFLVLFGITAWGMHVEIGWIVAFDLTWIERIQSFASEGRTSLIMIITELGNIRFIIVLTILLVIVLFFKRKYVEGLWLGGTILFCAAIATKILKTAFDRDRPNILQLITKTNESFPSGHATATTIFYGLIGLFIFLSMSMLWKKCIVSFITLAWITFILVSRVYLGVHFPTDVIAGFLFGMASIFISIAVYLIALDPLRELLGKLKLNDQSNTFARRSRQH